MATTRNRAPRPETDKPDTPAEAPVEDETTEAPATDESPETDTEAEPTEPTEPETDKLVIPDDYTPSSPLVANLLEMTLAAEEHKDDPTPIADFVRKADELFQVPVGYALAERLEEDGSDIEAAAGTFDAFKTLVTEVRKHAETVDRSVGDNLAKGLEALVNVPMGGVEDETDKSVLPIIIARWRQSAPKGSKSGSSGNGSSNGQSDVPDLFYPDGRKLRIRYNHSCGAKFSTGKDNLNSARREIIKHMVRSHPAQNSASKLAEGSDSYKAVTEGFRLTGASTSRDKHDPLKEDEQVDQVTKDDWTFKREAR